MTAEIWELMSCADELCARSEYAAARERCRRAARLSVEAESPRLHALAAERLVRIDLYEGHCADALRGVETVIDSWEQAGEPRPRAQALQKRAEILTQMDRLLDARMAWREARAALRDHGDSWDVLRCDTAIENLGDKIYRQARDERRAGANPDSSRRSVLGRRWPR